MDMDLIPRGFFMNDLFDEVMPPMKHKDNHMKCDIYEKDGKYHIEMDVPGYRKEDIKIEAEKDSLVITAEKNEEKNEEDENKKYIHRERRYGKYQRSFYLQDLNSDNIEASFNDGVLKITIPKKEEEQHKKLIDIK